MDYIYFLVYCTICVLFLDYRHAAVSHGKLIFFYDLGHFQLDTELLQSTAFMSLCIAGLLIIRYLEFFFLLCKKMKMGHMNDCL